MSIFIYIILVLFFLFFSIFIILFSVFVFDSILREHDLPTSKIVVKNLIKIISHYKPEASTFYDLGCGRGTVVLSIKKSLPRLEVYGIDNNAVRIFFAELKAVFLGQKIVYKKQDFFQTDLRNADIIYTYLWYDLMPPLENKLRKELKHGAIVITNTSKFPTWKPVERIVARPGISKPPDSETLFIYINP